MNNKLFKFDKDKIKGFDFIIGTDEAGRGCGAGPVCAAAVCFVNPDNKTIKLLSEVNDSKQLSAKKREELFDVIVENSIYSVNFGSVEEIEKYNILRTSLNTMKKSCLEVISKLDNNNLKVIVDGNKKIPMFDYEQETVVKGDGKSASIAAASILAKVSRDRLMDKLDKEYPEYHWSENKGYLTQAHLDAVDKYGLCREHRKKYFEKHFEKSKQLSLLN